MAKKLEKLTRQAENTMQTLSFSCHQLRATCLGQDRYLRRYWALPRAGAVLVEAIESADPEFFKKENLATLDSTPEPKPESGISFNETIVRSLLYAK